MQRGERHKQGGGDGEHDCIQKRKHMRISIVLHTLDFTAAGSDADAHGFRMDITLMRILYMYRLDEARENAADKPKAPLRPQKRGKGKKNPPRALYDTTQYDMTRKPRYFTL